MSGIKYYALDENEEVPYEFVVTRNVNGKPEFYASFVNTNSLAYGNGVLLKLHERNDDLRAENAKMRDFVHDLLQLILADGFDCYGCIHEDCNGMQYTDRCKLLDRACELGVEVP